MGWIKTLAAATAVATLTSGCAMYRLAELRQTTPTGTPFQKELARLYMDFASEDEKGYDWYNSWYFADKGLRAAYGKDVPPEDPKDWNIPADVLPDMEQAHGALLVALTPQNEDLHPTSAAQAQFYFDCWVQRQEENWQTDRIEYCREGLSAALDELNAVPAPVKIESETTPPKETKKKKHKKEKAAVKPKKMAEPAANTVEPHAEDSKADSAETTSYVVFFAGDRPVITDPGEKVLDDVVKTLKDSSNYEVILKSGAGSKVHSKLFEDRAAAVTKRLVDGGVKADAIKAGGEAGNAAKHVEIFLSQ